ncbi:putative LPS assembly protein LptD [Arcicella sp. LKC2W]|uniref:putative LPS assembly protein LptD n=1 Tax=Arcicella sp. LKC2W TaxID=2984198 RepID=UPI002B1F5D76|nr:putative LPS assembly protein LptD [Arcicella sp. LKC2W]MEA5459430.1 putative LPS assembly protein LptD [Arcicella sp. LKC2W]
MSIVISLLLGLLSNNYTSAQRVASGTFNRNSKKITTAIPKRDTIRADSITKAVPDSLKKNNDLQTTVVYSAKDSTIMDTQNQIVLLYGDATVTYGDVVLEADFIKLNWDKNEVFATGTKDSLTNKIKGKPVFKQGGEPYDADEIKYNFKSRKAIIKGLITKQGDAYVQGVSVKKDNEDNLYIRNAVYTTCNLAHPHYNIRASKIKMVGKKEIVSGPFHFELNELPLPIGLPFGFFPYKPPQENGTSGIIMPNYGEEPLGRGFFLREGGYYFAINENIGLRLTGEIYSKGSFGITANSQYVKRYRYGGSFNLTFRESNNGLEIGREYRNDFGIQWSHSPQSRGNSSFSASVNAQSNSNAQFNSLTSSNYISTALNSSIQYSKNFGQNIRTSVSLQADQNTITKAVNVNNNFSFGLNQFQPFKKKNAVTEKFWDGFRFGLDFNGSIGITNQVALNNRAYNSLPYNVNRQKDTTDTDPNKPLIVDPRDAASQTANLARDGVIPFELSGENWRTIKENANFKMTYSIPLALPNIKIGKYINLTPGMSLSGNVYKRKYNYKFLKPGESYVNSKNQTVTFRPYASDTLAQNGVVDIDTVSSPSADYQYSFSMSMNTRLYGTLNFNKGRLKGIRHIMTPSISMNYTPDFTDPSFGFYQEVQVSTKGTDVRTINGQQVTGSFRRISSFDPRQTNYGVQSGGINFSLSNTLEAKVRAKSDTAQKEFEKVTLIDNFALSTSYNFFVEQFKLAPISFSATSRVKKFDINLNGTFDPYKYEQDGSSLVGTRLDEYTAPSLANLGFSIGKSFQPGKAQQPKKSNNSDIPEDQVNQVNRNINDYVDWSVPWTFQFSYQYNYSKLGFAPAVIVSAATFNGSLKLTEKWDLKVQSGYDFVNKGISLTNIQVHRDLHCWEAAFNWTPAASPYYGRASSYSFEIRVKSALLQELKLSRRRTFYDRGGF